MLTLFVLVFLYLDDHIVLLRRAQVDFGSGLYSLPGGKVESGETARQAIVREVKEELALDIPEQDFTLVHTLHRQGTEGPFVALCFKAHIDSINDIYNNEPDKHSDMKLFPCHTLPVDILPAHKQIIESIVKGINYSEHGW